MTAPGRALTVRVEPSPTPESCYRWILRDPVVGELARSTTAYLFEEDAAEAARRIFGGWLDDITIDLERPDGSWERLR